MILLCCCCCYKGTREFCPYPSATEGDHYCRLPLETLSKGFHSSSREKLICTSGHKNVDYQWKQNYKYRIGPWSYQSARSDRLHISSVNFVFERPLMPQGQKKKVEVQAPNSLEVNDPCLKTGFVLAHNSEVFQFWQLVYIKVSI